MTEPILRDAMYRRRAFNAEVIELCVRCYISYRLSYRDLVEIMAERGIQIAHTTIYRAVEKHDCDQVTRANAHLGCDEPHGFPRVAVAVLPVAGCNQPQRREPIGSSHAKFSMLEKNCDGRHL